MCAVYQECKVYHLLLGMRPIICCFIFLFSVVRSVCLCVYCSKDLVGLGLLIVHASRSHSDNVTVSRAPLDE